MAKDCSFDIVSEVDLQEVDNAYQQACKEIGQRYDLKGTKSSIAFDKKAGTLTVAAPDEFVANQVIDVIQSKLIKRGIDLKAVSWGKPQDASGMSIRIIGTIVAGLDQDHARTINKDIKTGKFKVKTAIEGDKIRVSSPSRDELQRVISFCKEKDYDIPLQYTNYR